MQRLNIPGNYHTHTILCDGLHPPEEMVLSAIHRGFRYLGFSGHMDTDIHMDMPVYQKMIQDLKQQYAEQIEILCGVEYDQLYSGNIPDDLDYRIGSTHFMDVDYERPLSVDNTENDIRILIREVYGSGLALAKAYFELETHVIDKTQCDIVGHFDLIAKLNDVLHFVDEDSKAYQKTALEAIDALLEQDVLFEINTRGLVHGRLYPGDFILKRIGEKKGKIIINSDAHRADEIDFGFETACAKAKACGFKCIYVLSKTQGVLNRIEIPLKDC